MRVVAWISSVAMLVHTIVDARINEYVDAYDVLALILLIALSILLTDWKKLLKEANNNVRKVFSTIHRRGC